MGHFMKSQAVTSLREKINDDELLNIAPANDEISTPTPSTWDFDPLGMNMQHWSQ